MKTLVPFLAAFALTLGTAATAQDHATREPVAPQQPEKRVYKLGSVVDENLKLTDLDGKSLTFKELRGKVVFLHFWSAECPFEKVADPKVAALEERWKGNKDVVVLAINANASEIGTEPPSDNYATLREHMKERGMKSRVFADHGNHLADLFQARSTPHCFVLDRKGAVVYAGGLDDDPRGDKGEAAQQFVRDAVEATLAGKEVTVKESKPYGCSIKRVKA